MPSRKHPACQPARLFFAPANDGKRHAVVLHRENAIERSKKQDAYNVAKR
jgi:hypothetical protein